MAEKKEKRSKKLWRYRIGSLMFAVVFGVSAFLVVRSLIEERKEADAFKQLSRYAAECAGDECGPAGWKNAAGPLDLDAGEAWDGEDSKSGKLESEELEPEELEPEDAESDGERAARLKAAAGYAALGDQNQDYIGWIEIPDTGIDYPVMCRKDDPEYYLHRSFDGSHASGGTPFLSEASSPDSICMIVYGHNMKNGTMFGTLDSYRNTDYMMQHPEIIFYVNGEARIYEVFAAVETKVPSDGKRAGDEFQYYNCAGDISMEEYGRLVSWLQKNSCYDAGIVPVYEEQILMLSTCSYHTKNGRFVVAARLESADIMVTTVCGYHKTSSSARQ